MQPPTPIFHLTARYKADPHPKKLNLGVGAYRDEQVRPYVFGVVRKAEEALLKAGGDKEYLPITGLPAFNVRHSMCSCVVTAKLPPCRACYRCRRSRPNSCLGLTHPSSQPNTWPPASPSLARAA
jgi:hypothetical protein